MAGLKLEAAKAAVRAAGLKLTSKAGKEMLAGILETAVEQVAPAFEIDWASARKEGALMHILSELAAAELNPMDATNWSVSEFRSAFCCQSATQEQKITMKFPLLF